VLYPSNFSRRPKIWQIPRIEGLYLVKNTWSYVVVMSGLLAMLTGCQSAPRAPRMETNVSDATRNNTYSLLYDLLGDEKDVSKLRFIKREESEVKQLLIRISQTAREAHKQLEAFARQDGGLNLQMLQLPVGEVAVRKDIAAAEQHQLLHESGERLEFDLLLTQTDALRYGTHLAKVASQNDFNAARAQYLGDLSQRLQSLYDESVALLARLPELERK
jgi:hypothetical protein